METSGGRFSAELGLGAGWARSSDLFVMESRLLVRVKIQTRREVHCCLGSNFW